MGFGFQLFFDFAGYSHIVIGAARPDWLPSRGEFRPAVSVAYTRSFLDALAHVAFVMDSRLCVSADGLTASRPLVGVFQPAVVDGGTAACGMRPGNIRRVGCLSRGPAGGTSNRPASEAVIAVSMVAKTSASRFPAISTFCLVSRVGCSSALTPWRRPYECLGPFSRSDPTAISLPLTFYVATSAIVLARALYHASEALLARWRAAQERRLMHLAGLNVLAVELWTSVRHEGGGGSPQ